MKRRVLTASQEVYARVCEVASKNKLSLVEALDLIIEGKVDADGRVKETDRAVRGRGEETGQPGGEPARTEPVDEAGDEREEFDRYILGR